jgi:hypothetical protein
MMGLTIVITGGFGVADFFGTWATRSERAEWTVDVQRGYFADAVEKLRDTLTAAKCKHVGKLVGTPVEVICEGGLLKSWRVLEEVL